MNLSRHFCTPSLVLCWLRQSFTAGLSRSLSQSFSTLSPHGAGTIKANPQRLKEVNQEIEQMGAKVVQQWAVLGPYDFVNIVEAPDEKVIARVSMELAARGTAHFQTLTAIPVDEFLAALK